MHPTDSKIVQSLITGIVNAFGNVLLQAFPFETGPCLCGEASCVGRKAEIAFHVVGDQVVPLRKGAIVVPTMAPPGGKS